MKKYIVVGLLAFLAVTGAVIEGLVELSPQLTQLNGLVMIICTAKMQKKIKSIVLLQK